MENRLRDLVYHDSRTDLRIEDNRRVLWRQGNNPTTAKGTIRNISTSGMLFEAKSDVVPLNETVFNFEPQLGPRNYVPLSGKVIWLRRKDKTKNTFFYGIQFIKPGQFVLKNLNEKVQQRLAWIEKSDKLVKVGNATFAAIVTVLTGVSLWLVGQTYENMRESNRALLDNAQQQAALTQSYAHRFYATQLQLASVQSDLDMTKQLYAESEGMLKNVSEELESTKVILAQTEAMLANAQAGNTELSGNINSIRSENAVTKAQLEQTIASLQQSKDQLTREMAGLQGQLDYLSGNVNSSREANELLKLYKVRMKQVRLRVREFRQEARSVKIAAQKEKDRIKLVLGNNGYFVKDGETVVVDEQKYRQADAGVVQQQDISAPKDNIAIDVKIVD